MTILMIFSRFHRLYCRGLQHELTPVSGIMTPVPLSSILERWERDQTVRDNISAWQKYPAQTPVTVPLPDDLLPRLTRAMVESGYTGLYQHQRDAWEAIKSGKSVVICTGTASGKSLCYHLPVLDRLLRDPNARALYLFPTKALAQDQLTGVSRLINTTQTQFVRDEVKLPSLPVMIYDGDTPTSQRAAIRKNARILISNPDMLHTGILPHHTLWAEFFQNLQYVVLDEAHTYRGVFGSHVANVIRRLKRIAKFYGSLPGFILTSATIANPVEMASKLVEEKVMLINRDTSARGPRNFILYNPPIIHRELGLRRSALQECLRLSDDLLSHNVQTVIFTRSRRSVELLLTYLRQAQSAAPQIPSQPLSSSRGRQTDIRGYRSGYLPSQRREIEAGLRSGSVRTVVATNALELGIDIGGLEAAILVGYPGTIAATLQQAGRAGRREQVSLAILVAASDPLDQFLARQPEYLFSQSPEQALLDPDNLVILLKHLRCATFELPFQAGEGFGNLDPNLLQEMLDYLHSEGVLHRTADRYYWMADQYPAQSISLRTASAVQVALQALDDHNKTIGYVDLESACWLVHPGAIYLHEAQAYLVELLDLENHVAYLSPAELDYYTEPRLDTTVELLEVKAETLVRGGKKSMGDLRVIQHVTGYKKVRWYTQETLGVEPLDLPPSELISTGYWVSINQESVDRLRQANLWINDPNQYGANWQRQSELARLRDLYHCQACGIPEQGRAHDVHHKIPLRAFRTPEGGIRYEEANHLDNLITLCPACHRRAEAVVRIRSGLAGFAYVLVHLAPVFLMCDPRDLGVHADSRSPLAEGMPCVVLYERIPAGVGFSGRLYEIHDTLLNHCFQLVRDCPCEDGCPSCVGPAGESGVGGKVETLALLECLTTVASDVA